MNSSAPSVSPSSVNCAGGISRLAVQNFRSYDTFVLDVHAPQIVLTGANGIGKTNLLEAISLLSPGRGLRGAKPADWTRKGGGARYVAPIGQALPWGVSLTLEDGQRVSTMAPEKAGARNRALFHEGAPLASQALLAEFLAVVWLTPQMDGLFIGEASLRRKFVDRLVYAVNPDHAVRLYRYDHALRQRNKLLKERAPAALIRSLHPVLVAEGVAIAAARLEVTEKLNEALYGFISPFPLPSLEWSGQIEQWLQEKDALSVEDLYRHSLDTSIEEDRSNGQTRLGVHRSDVLATHRQKRLAAAQCSTGEQKALLLSLILAHAQWLKTLQPDRPLILLLDDLGAHLDTERRADVCRWIAGLPVQSWFTGTEPEMFGALSGQAQFIQLPLVST